MRLNCIDSGSLPAGSPLQVARERASGGGKGELSSLSLDYEQSLFFLGPSSKTPETRKWPRAWLKFPTSHTCVSLRVRLSSDFSRLPQVESLLIGYARKKGEKKLVGSNDHPMSLAKKKEKKQHIKISFLAETDDLTWPNMTSTSSRDPNQGSWSFPFWKPLLEEPGP